MAYIYGRNPVIEALTEGGAVQKVYIQHGQRSGKIQLIYRLSRQQKIPIVTADARKLNQMVGQVVHQGVVALTVPVQILSEDDFQDHLERVAAPACFLILDQIQDPHNMGAIIRSAEVFGADGVIFTGSGSSPVTEVVVKSSAGAALKIPLYRVGNLARMLDLLKEKNLWIYSSSLSGDTPLWQVDLRRSCAIIIGGEKKGVRSLLQKKSDVLFMIPQKGATQSLNASVAAGVILSEMLRQRHSTEPA